MTSEDHRLRDLAQQEIAPRHAGSIETEQSEESERCAKQSQRDAEHMRIDDAIERSHPVRCDDGRDQALWHVPDPDTQSEIVMTRHHRFMRDQGFPPDMQHLEAVGLETDDRVFATGRRLQTAHVTRVIGHGRRSMVSTRSIGISEN